ncbi:unnamed protein product [Arabidopsis halleri]
MLSKCKIQQISFIFPLRFRFVPTFQTRFRPKFFISLNRQ